MERTKATGKGTGSKGWSKHGSLFSWQRSDDIRSAPPRAELVTRDGGEALADGDASD